MVEFVGVAFFLALISSGYYVFRLMPQQRDFVKRQRMARSLAEGDEVITGGGMIGYVRAIDGDAGIAEVEIADGVIVRMVTAAILDRYIPEEVAKNAQMGQEQPEEVAEPTA